LLCPEALDAGQQGSYGQYRYTGNKQGPPMPMSDEERKLLKELELGLIADDPHLAMELLSGYPSRRLRAGFYFGSAAGLLGLVLFIAGLGSQVVGIGVTGFLLMAFGAYLALHKHPFRRRGRGGQPT
jgi:VIT1/CCC1 family predicted Fe2+/Mn2+ transporter